MLKNCEINVKKRYNIKGVDFMPSIVTHHYFAKDVLKKLPKEIQNTISPSIETYYIFAQSFDNLFYYKFFTPWKGKEIRELGTKAQQIKVNLYFENILNFITNNGQQKNTEILAHLYGSICHYCLDSTTHPFIIYEAGHISANKKYRGNHEKAEVSIDAYIYKKKENKNLKSAKLAHTLLPKIKLSKELKELLDEVFDTTFQFQNIGQIYEESFRTGNFILNFFVTDKTGIKKTLYHIKDTITPNSHRKYANLSFHVSKIDETYLNLDHQKWHHPITNESHQESFEELYNIALKTAINIIKEIHDYLNKKAKKKETILQTIGNKSYATGLDCTHKETFTYFKY